MDCRIIRDKYRNCWVSMPGERSRGGQGKYNQVTIIYSGTIFKLNNFFKHF